MRFGAFVLVLVACGGGAAVVSTTDPVAPPPGDDAVGPPRPEGEHALDAAAPQRPVLVPDGLDDVDVTTTIRTDTGRRPISPLLYGMNTAQDGTFPPAVLAGVTFLRRGGDRSNAYDWETNISNGAAKAGWANDRYLARNLERPDAPGELDRVLIAADLAAGRGTMIPFVLNDHVAGPVASGIPWDRAGFDIAAYFRRVDLVKPAPFAATPDLADGVVYTDENVDFLRRQFPGDIYAAGPTQVMVGSDNEPDLYVSNFPMLQRGTGDVLRAPNGIEVGRRLTGADFTARYLRFATRVKEIAPAAYLVGPDHFHFDGYTNFHTPGAGGYTDDGRWYMDDFLGSVRAASEAAGVRLLHTWDFHWYPQQLFGGTFAWKLDDSVRPMTDAEVDAVVQGPRSYWDPEFDEHSWITDDHLHGPARILERLLPRVEAGYPGTKVGVTEYFPGGCAHVSSALGVVETLGIFARMGVHVAAMWPHTCDLGFAFGGFRLLRNVDGSGLGFDATNVAVEHPEKVESSVYAASDGDARVTVLVVNKSRAPRRIGLRLYHPDPLASVSIWTVDATHAEPARVADDPLVKANAYAYRAPPMSAALLVFRTRAR